MCQSYDGGCGVYFIIIFDNLKQFAKTFIMIKQYAINTE